MNRPSTGQLAQIACLMECTARKPGNVHRSQDFDDCSYVDFLLSATALARPLDRVRQSGVGSAVLAAVEATRQVVSSNTNVGMILLLAPLAAVPANESLETGIGPVLDATTVEDARNVYSAIRLAEPGGLGTVPNQDVRHEPTVTLVEAMCLAADRDLVARQYANRFAEVLRLALPALRKAQSAGQTLETAIIAAHLTLMAELPDTLIARKRGRAEADESARRAAAVLAAGWPGGPAAESALQELDAWLRAEGHARNPGTTADLITAALFAALRDGTIQLPRPAGPAGWSDRP